MEASYAGLHGLIRDLISQLNQDFLDYLESQLQLLTTGHNRGLLFFGFFDVFN